MQPLLSALLTLAAAGTVAFFLTMAIDVIARKLGSPKDGPNVLFITNFAAAIFFAPIALLLQEPGLIKNGAVVIACIVAQYLPTLLFLLTADLVHPSSRPSRPIASTAAVISMASLFGIASAFIINCL
jgi:hypothetical protein